MRVVEFAVVQLGDDIAVGHDERVFRRFFEKAQGTGGAKRFLLLDVGHIDTKAASIPR